MGMVGNWLGGAMGEDGSAICDWTWDDNKLFELALAVVDEGSPNWWEAVASMVGNKSAGEVERHYDILLEDLKFIESGKLDYLFGEAFDGKGALCYTEEGQK